MSILSPGSHLGKLNPEPREEEKSPIVDNLGQKQDSCLCADDRAYQGRGWGWWSWTRDDDKNEFGGVVMSDNAYL